MSRKPVLLKGQRLGPNGSVLEDPNAPQKKSSLHLVGKTQASEQEEIPQQHRFIGWMKKAAPGIKTLSAPLKERLSIRLRKWEKKLLPPRKGRRP